MKSKVRRAGIIPTILIVLLLGSGTGVILYPHVCQYIYQKEAREINQEYQKRMQEYEEQELEWLYRMIVEYNQGLFEEKQGKMTDVFSYEQIGFSLMQFGFEEEMIGYLTVPRMNIELPIYLGASKSNLERGSAHLTQTSLPVGGNNTNAVIAAHRGMGTAAMFRQIEKLKRGDMIYITNFRETLSYQVIAMDIILPADIDRILIQEGRDLVTLITCHPYRYNYQRYIVYCERVL